MHVGYKCLGMLNMCDQECWIVIFVWGKKTIFEVGFISIMLSEKDTSVHQNCRKDAEHLFLPENAVFVVLPGDLVTFPHLSCSLVHMSHKGIFHCAKGKYTEEKANKGKAAEE